VKNLVLSTVVGMAVGVAALCVLSLIGWAAGSLAGLSFSFHAGISAVWLVVFLAVQLGSGIAASWSAARFYGRHSWSAPLAASTGLAALMAVHFSEDQARRSCGWIWGSWRCCQGSSSRG
jgi:hypothetical protein